ncbi:hypothetical protein PHSC3_000873 [Chlamydiales bacterium STE3]|nr:hypothetical protein PHSC3_000873 [Chlamydiales bacterium STE3]
MIPAVNWLNPFSRRQKQLDPVQKIQLDATSQVVQRVLKQVKVNSDPCYLIECLCEDRKIYLIKVHPESDPYFVAKHMSCSASPWKVFIKSILYNTDLPIPKIREGALVHPVSVSQFPKMLLPQKTYVFDPPATLKFTAQNFPVMSKEEWQAKVEDLFIFMEEEAQQKAKAYLDEINHIENFVSEEKKEMDPNPYFQFSGEKERFYQGITKLVLNVLKQDIFRSQYNTLETLDRDHRLIEIVTRRVVAESDEPSKGCGDFSRYYKKTGKIKKSFLKQFNAYQQAESG